MMASSEYKSFSSTQKQTLRPDRIQSSSSAYEKPSFWRELGLIFLEVIFNKQITNESKHFPKQSSSNFIKGEFL